MHGRARIPGDQWRRVRTRDSGTKRGELCVWADMRKHEQDGGRHAKMLQRLYRLLRQRRGSVYSCPIKYFMQVGKKVFGGLCTEDIVPVKIVRLSKVGSLHAQLISLPSFGSPRHLEGMLRKEKVIYNINYVEDLHFDYLNFLCDLFLPVTIPHVRFHQTCNFFKKKLIYYSSFILNAKNKKSIEVIQPNEN